MNKKIALITGGSRGLGKSSAIAAAQRGVGIILTYNSYREGAEAVVETIRRSGGHAVALPLDVTQPSSFTAFAEQVRHALQANWQRTSFDYLVNNAGFGGYNLIENVGEEEFDRLFLVHLKGPFFLTQKLLPLIERGGQILNITSGTSRVAFAGCAPYASFKGAMDVLTRYMAKEFGERRIRVNSVAPGAIRTDLGGGLDNQPEFIKMLTDMTALGRVGDPDDVGLLVASLLSDDSRWVNAQRIEVSGGMTI